MADPKITRLRRDVLASAAGRVVEIGMGSGLNLPLYPDAVQSVVGIDPNPGMNARAQARAKASRFLVEVRAAGGESLPLEDSSFDTAVATFVLCTIPAADRALAEVRRVLNDGGRLLLLEHGLSDDPKVQKWQRRLNPLQRIVACGCNLDRNIKALVEGNGFRFETLRTLAVPGVPKTHGFVYAGDARKS